MSATTTQLLSSGEFCKLRYDTIPVKSASANVSFYSNISKKQKSKILSCDTLCIISICRQQQRSVVVEGLYSQYHCKYKSYCCYHNIVDPCGRAV